MKSIRIFQYIILGISLLFVATTCQREEEVTLAELFVRNQHISPQYTTAQLSCAFECNGTFKQAMVYYSPDFTFEEYQSQDMTKQKDGSWLVELENLLNDTTYYVRYEVLNSYSNLVAEQIDTFATRPYEVPQLSPTIVLDTTSNSASIAGKIISNGGLPITERGVCYGLSSTPILEDSLYIVCTQDVDSFVCELKDLNVVTTYYARAYAKNEKGIAYGEEVSFTTLSTIPSVGAIATTNIALTSVTIAGEILSDGGATLTECGICYSMLGTPTIDNDKVMSSANVGSFNCQLDNLKMGTTYYARLYATNANGTVYSNPIEFTTLTTTAEIITTEATNITAVSAIIGGDIVSDGGEAVTVRGVCYADKPNPTIADSKIESGEGIGTFSCMLDDLHPGTIYYARAYAVNKQGTAYGNEISFTTLCILAEVTTAVPTAIGLTDATVGGEVVSDGGAEITERGVCFATLENPTLDNSEKQICGAGIGNFTTKLSDLQRGTTYYVRAYAINSEGIAYGEQQSFMTSSTKASVVTAIPSNIGLIEATVGGEVIDDGGASVSERGICYSHAANPTIANNKIQKGAGIGVFTHKLTNLTMGATYHVRAYATNVNGTVYGESISFTMGTTTPTVSTSSITNITPTSATIEGNVIADGGSAIIERGICYSNTNQKPTTNDLKIAQGTGIGVFTCELTDLALGTTYYVCAYATNGNGTQYGEVKSFTTGTLLPTLESTPADNITAIGATVGGNITSDGGAEITARGVCYSTKENPTVDDTKVSSGAGVGEFSCNLTGLTFNTTYYVRAYATNSKGTAYGNLITFKTLTTTPTVVTNAASNITATSATVGGNVTNDGGANVTVRGICYSTNANPTIEGDKVASGSGIGEFDCNITGLAFNTKYYARAYATNANGTVYGEEVTFTTLASMGTLTTSAASNITVTSATVGGNITSDGGAEITARGVCYSIKENPTVEDTKVSSGAGVGEFSCNLTGLTFNTTYYVRAYATNSKGTAYGNLITFKTLTTTPTVVTNAASNITATSATVGGNVTNDGGANVTVRGICYSTNANPTIEGDKVASGSGIGEFDCNITGLAFNTKYYARAYATNANGTVYGEEVTFTTLASMGTLTTSAASNITVTSATVGGNITSDGGAEITARGVCYSTKENPTVEDTKVASGSGVGEFSCNLTGLTFNTTYYVRAYATNSKGTAYGNQITFKTLTTTPTVVTSEASNISATSATVGGNVTNDGGSEIIARGICYGTKENPTISDSKVDKSGTTGTYSCTLEELSVATTYYARAYATNANGTVYGEEVTFTTLASMGTLTTSAASNITVTSATVGGNITSDGGAEITARGVCYSTKENPTVEDTKVASGSGVGEFSCNLTGLTFNTTYYVRAYATNSKGTAYGNQITFKTLTTTPTVVTNAASNITATSATVGGNVTNDGGSEIIARGICYGTKENPTISDKKVDNSGTTGTYSCTLEGLSVATTYYARAYATNANGIVYGEEVTFTTLASMGTLTTSAASNITVTSATVGGNITSDGGAEITARGVCYSTKENPTIDDTKVSSGSGVGEFSCNLTGLTFNTTYYVRAYATNSKGTAYGNQITFKTLTTTPTVVTSEASNISATSATVGGNITSDGGATIIARGICYSTKPTPTISDNKVDKSGTIGTYSCTLEGLSAATTYYARAYATNANGTVYGEEVTFTTLASMGTLTTSAASNITVTSATVGGNITSDGGAEITARGVCYSTKENPTVEDTKVASGSGVGEFSCNLTGLTFNTTYYVRAYATNSKGTAYGNQITFKTLTTTPTVVTSEASNITATSATVGGNVTNDGGSEIIARGICYGTKENPTISDKKVDNSGTTGTYNCTLEGLSAGTTYYARAYATNANGTMYGEQITFATIAGKPNVVTLEATDVTGTTATLGGNVLSSGGADVLKRGICYATTANPTTSNKNVTCGSGVGEFTCSVMDLSPNTTYYVRAYATNTKGTAYAEQISFTTQCTAPTMGATTISVVGINSAIIEGSILHDGGSTITERGICYNTTGGPTIADDAVIVESISNSFTGKLTNLQENTTYYARAYAINDIGVAYGEEVSFTNSTNGHEYVDLGLSVMWATCNVGADSPEDYGDYFAWGETEPKDDYRCSTYKWRDVYENYTKYCTDNDHGNVDNKTVLESTDDAAIVNWGGVWRMPTVAEMKELTMQCTWTWTTQNGVNGCKVTSKSNGNSIFLPAAGCYYYEYGLTDAGLSGVYWSSSLDTYNSDQAIGMYFIGSGEGYSGGGLSRCYGLSVRPVCP